MHRSFRILARVSILAGWARLALVSTAQTLPLEIRQTETSWNLQSLRGVPISSVVGVPPGSDGRMTNRNESGSALLPTTNQFRGFVAFGGVPGLLSNQWVAVRNSSVLQAGSGAFSAAVATAMQLPLGLSNGAVAVVFRRAQVGAPYLTRQVSYPFGAIVDAPITDENGLPLGAVAPSDYWLAEPYTTNGHTNSPYYWSPHAGKVYAIQAGPISIRWVKAAYSATPPADYAAHPENYWVNGGNYFRVHTVNYLVSGTPVKPPRRMYWTEREFRLLGKQVAVPAARVGAVNIVYNTQFPRTVASEYRGPGQTSPTDGSTNQPLQELRTLWYDAQQGNISAYNHEGRVFVELLGDVRGNGQTRESLGFEIVEVVRQPSPLDVRIELGDRILPPPPGDPDALTPEPVLQAGGASYAYAHTVEGRDTIDLYATRETRNLNDYLVHWMESGVEGLKWPALLGRYALVWPADLARYSHYLRPAGATETEARATAVTLPTGNVPVIEYQDPLDQPRAKLTETFQFYTFLDAGHPLHRTLLRFTSGDRVAFERVFSWWEAGLGTPHYAGNPIAAGVDGYDAGTGMIAFGDRLTAPRIVEEDVEIGRRLEPPADEPASREGLLAAHVRIEKGDLFDARAYVDPFVEGFEAAHEGAVLPVNTLPGNDRLEVWWFRPNGADTSAGFETLRWPSVIGRYHLRWPREPRDIVLARNDGSGALSSLEAKGTVYFQNDRTLPGFNPNEEHAFMQGGQVWALRDDLNRIGDSEPSSEPYVLLSYTAADGRPAMEVFRVLREKGWDTFNYRVEAGTRLQPPMPLPLMDKPLGPKVTGAEPTTLNQEAYERTVAASSSPSGGSSLELVTRESNLYKAWYRELALQSPDGATTRWFFATNTDPGARRLQGFLSSQRGTSLGAVTLPTPTSELTVAESLSFAGVDSGGFPTLHTFRKYVLAVRQPVRFATVGSLSLSVGQEYYVVSPTMGTSWRWTASAASPAFVDIDHRHEETWWTTNEVQTLATPSVEGRVAAFVGTLAPVEEWAEGALLFVPGGTSSPGQFVNWVLRTEPVPASGLDTHATFTLRDRKGDVWVYRGPHDAADRRSYMLMQFYYKTLPGFYFPSLPLGQQPPAGTITPYLRARNSDGSYVGDPVYGNRLNPIGGDDNALGIAYRPAWPTAAPVLQMAETLTVPKRGLPAVRGQTSLELVYQQSRVQNRDRISVRLHDPTRDKEYSFGAPDSTVVLGKIPDSVKSEAVRGLTYFPLLPPHLSDRFFFDPNRGPFGTLVFRGMFVDDAVGDDYLHLNVLSAKDATTLSNLCLVGDPARALWGTAIAALRTSMETFVESPQKPGTYVPAGGANVVGPGDLADVSDDDVAVDSYALTAVGPGTGYVTLIAGNGLAFTPREEPVQMLVMRVSDVLYPGEVKIVAPSNPLSEQLTMQQVVDLAGAVQDYDFQWKITAPVDGLPPEVYRATPKLLLGSGDWQHLRVPWWNGDGAGSAGSLWPRGTVSVGLPGSGIVPVGALPFGSASFVDGNVRFQTPESLWLRPGSVVVASVETTTGGTLTTREIAGRVGRTWRTYSQTNVTESVEVDFGRTDFRVLDLREATAGELAEFGETAVPQSSVSRDFTVTPGNYSQVWLSLDLDDFLGATVYLNGERIVVVGQGGLDTPTASAPAGFSALPRAYRLDPSILSRVAPGASHRISVDLYSSATAGTRQNFDLRLEAYEAVDETGSAGSPWLDLDPARFPDGVRTVLGESADVRALSDNYLIMRYRARDPAHASYAQGWSRWTEPQLAEGWIKRVLAGINPFNQRVVDLFNNRIDTEASLLTAAGKRWEGDVALNLDTINDYGLIEIYETVLRRGRMLSIDAGINYGPANDALLLAAGYLSDLYSIVGNEAWADAANPTIGIGTADRTYGDIATALFAFKGQVPSLLEEELALLRGRDDFLQPGVQRSPVYNRLVWNYTRGIDAGEVTYAVNYNILESPKLVPDGAIDAADAARMYPQGHGDAYGHYLTALKGYYSLLSNRHFDWVPRIEAVSVLGQPVSVDYQDERKFAAAAVAVMRAGRQVVDLTWRRDGQAGHDAGWSHLSATRTNPRSTLPTTRYWGVDHWASRTALGGYVNWVTGNAMLPAIDPDPGHEGIQKVDRTTVPELTELATMAGDLQAAVDGVEAGATPLGLPAGGVALDIQPGTLGGVEGGTHFEQVYERAKGALNNAVAAFDDAKDVTRLMRSEQDSLAEFQASVARQEWAYDNALIELYGTPYTDDIGPGGTYAQGYAGPDLVHFGYTEMPQLTFPGLLTPDLPQTFRIDIQNFPDTYDEDTASDGLPVRFDFVRSALADNPEAYRPGLEYLEYTLSSDGSFRKPSEWTGRRASPGRLQEAIGRIHLAHAEAVEILASHEWKKRELDRAIAYFEASRTVFDAVHEYDEEKASVQLGVEGVLFAARMVDLAVKNRAGALEKAAEAAIGSLPTSGIFGLATGGDLTSAMRGAIATSYLAASETLGGINFTKQFLTGAFQVAKESGLRLREVLVIQPMLRDLDRRRQVMELDTLLGDLQGMLYTMNQRLQKVDDAVRQYRALSAQGDRLQAERAVYRQRAAAVIQGYRTRDAAFRSFRDEKLERYKALFDLAARYAFLAAQAYDYETGLLNSETGRNFVGRILGARALGVVRDGEPQYAGSNSGDPGLSGALAEMKADWDVVKGRLGFNRPDAYGTTVSLRTENFRILASTNSDATWIDVLQRARLRDLREDEDVRRHCLEIERGSGLPVPGLVLEFATTVTKGRNLFGRDLAAGDHAFGASAFATKIFGVGVALEGYRGMDQPRASAGAGGISPTDPGSWFVDPLGLAATPEVYLIPVGTDYLRTAPIAGVDEIRGWAVDDVAIPLPFDIGASGLDGGGFYQTAASLTEPLFAVRRHGGFRPVPDASYFSPSLYTSSGTLQRSQYTNNRLVGRSAWNSRWKLVIPGHALLQDPEEGLERFVRTVRDVKLHFVTYSYAGN